jgi:hypothetical protein
MKTSAPWILFAIALLVIMYLVTCNKPAPMVPKNQFDALQQKYDDTLASYRAFRKKSDSAIDDATVSAIQANERAEQSQAALDQERAKIGRLLVKLDSAANEKQDSSWVSVSPRYKDGCDSLRRENLTMNYRIIQFEQDNQAHVDALNYETRVRDSIIEKERAFNEQFRRQLENCITAGKQQEKASLPRTQLYGGIAAWGSQASPLGGGEINLALKTKRDQIYEIKGAYILNTWWAGIGAKFKFSLK